MSSFVFHTLNCLGRVIQNNSSLILSTTRLPVILTQTRGTKHWLPKWKKWRAAKVIRVKLPNYDNTTDEMDDNDFTTEKARTKMKELGLQPAQPWVERQTFISATGGIFEPYVPPEGDGRYSIVSKTGVQQKADFMKKKGTSYMAVRKIRKFDEYFSIGEFEETAQEVYEKAHESVQTKDENEICRWITEKAYPEVTHNVSDKTIRWKFIESLELPRVVHARCTNVISKENVFAQLTVRFHNQQTLAIYDRFGRLMHGSEVVKKDVLEYVVFEKHLANVYGTWRIHGKIIPDWMPSREYADRTYLASSLGSVEPEKKADPSTAVSTSATVEIPADATSSGSQKSPPVATA